MQDLYKLNNKVGEVMSKKLEIEFICIECGCKPEPDSKQSSKNWDVINIICTKCGGKISPKIK
jgi:ribosomal protein L44E